MTVFIAAMMRPFLLLFLYAFIAWPLAKLIDRCMPDSKVKRFLFKKRWDDL